MIDPEKFTERIDFDFAMTDKQRAILSGAVRQEHFDVLQHLMEDEIHRFNTKLINTPLEDKDAILANHMGLKVASQFYVSLMRRIKDEVNLERYNAARVGTPDNPENPISVEDYR